MLGFRVGRFGGGGVRRVGELTALIELGDLGEADGSDDAEYADTGVRELVYTYKIK